MSEDDNNLTSRMGRYAKVSGTALGLGARLAGEKFFGFEIGREDHAVELMQALGGLKGPIMKVGQILATIPEALPPEYAKAFQELQANAPPMGWSFVRRRMKTELGADWQNKFKQFSQEAAAAASLGQVHKATLPDGRVVACKLQYPDMSSAVEADLSQLKMIFGLYEKMDKSVSTKHIHAELSARLREELDYELEARYCRLYHHMLANEPRVHVPEVIDECSSNRLLTTTWLDGTRIMNFVDAPLEIRNKIAKSLFSAWYIPLYFYGVIHGDPHLGNYSVRDNHTLNLMDFGCVRIFKPNFVGGVIDLYKALLENDEARAVHAYETWGFTNLSNELIDVLNTWARFLYGPVMDDKVRIIGKAQGEVYGADIAKKVHKRLRELGGVTPPREFVFMDRAALGLGSVFIHLQAEVNWFELFNETISTFNIDEMAARQAQTLAKFGLNQGHSTEA